MHINIDFDDDESVRRFLQFLKEADIPITIPYADESARAEAAKAREQARLANSQSSQNMSKIGDLDRSLAKLFEEVRELRAKI